MLGAPKRHLTLSGHTCPPVSGMFPEDVSGVSGYEEFLEVIFDPTNEEYEHGRQVGPWKILLSAEQACGLVLNRAVGRNPACNEGGRSQDENRSRKGEWIGRFDAKENAGQKPS